LPLVHESFPRLCVFVLRALNLCAGPEATIFSHRLIQVEERCEEYSYSSAGLDGSSWAHAVAARTRTKTSNAAGTMVSVKKVADLRGGLVRFGWWRELESVFYTADAKQSFHLISSPRNFKAKRREPNPTATLTTK
jgi:hypothetical protein